MMDVPMETFYDGYWLNDTTLWPYEFAEMCHGVHHMAPTMANFQESTEGKLLGGLWNGEPAVNPKLTFLLGPLTFVTCIIAGRPQDWELLADRCTFNLHCSPDERLGGDHFHKTALHCFQTRSCS